jgi:poly(3-hydroxybutyrate) depolymerase
VGWGHGGRSPRETAIFLAGIAGRPRLGQGGRVLRRYGLSALCLALAAGFTAISSGAEAVPSPGCARPAAAGVSTRTITVGTAKRTYLLAVPQSATTGGPLPVIMGLHGGSDTAQNAFRYMGLAGHGKGKII